MKIDLSEDSTRIRLARIIEHLASSSRSPVDTPDKLTQAARQVGDQLQEAGCRVQFDPVPFRGGHFENVYGTLDGLRNGPPLILAAHHDSAPGTPDVASLGGLAVLLETARACAGTTPEFPLMFASYTLKNWGMAGSAHHAGRLGGRRSVLGVVNLHSLQGGGEDLSGLPPSRLFARFSSPRRNTLSIVGNFASRSLLRTVVRGMRDGTRHKVSMITLPGRGFLVPWTRSGDHAPFWDGGIPAVMVTDSATLRHTPPGQSGDCLEIPTLSLLEDVVEGVTRIMHNLSSPNKLNPNRAEYGARTKSAE